MPLLPVILRQRWSRYGRPHRGKEDAADKRRCRKFDGGIQPSNRYTLNLPGRSGQTQAQYGLAHDRRTGERLEIVANVRKLFSLCFRLPHRLYPSHFSKGLRLL